MMIRNNRADAVQLWWVNYDGNPVYYATISSGRTLRQLTYGTHPWVITSTSGDLVTLVIPYASNMDITVE